MKKNIFVKGVMTALVATVLSSCASDYLDRAPITYDDENRINATTKTAQLAAWGVCRSMYFGYSVAQKVQFMNGEPWINSMYGEVFAQDAWYPLWQDFGGEMMNGTYLRQKNYWMPQMPWMYSYNLISQSNKILDYIDHAAGTQAERDYIKAQLLTIRSHAYVKLLQFYAPRWEDSNNGATPCIVLRTTYSTASDAPLATMKEVVDQVYGDLKNAIKLYEGSSSDRKYYYEPDLSIAQGILARCAMIVHDWTTARDMARAARADYPIMSAAEYAQGFCEPNAEWMWCNATDLQDEYLGTITWGGQYACNGGYVYSWGLGAGAINYDLYRQMDPKDTRRALFWTPDKQLRVPIRPQHFWDPTYVDALNMNMNTQTANGSPSLMTGFLKNFVNKALPNGDITKFQVQAYRSTGDSNDDLVGIVPFGAQVKFWGMGPYSTTAFPFMRGAEMALIEAEACYMLQDETGAKAALTELNQNRITDYSCTTSGDALLEEIRLSRRIELWGEGFCWTDLKRWNLPSVRRAWVAGDVNSNNIPEAFAETVQPTALNGWRIIIPDAEVDYNTLISKYTGY